jgi:hypothetical protein
VTGGWRRLHNEEIHNLYTSRNIIILLLNRPLLPCGVEGFLLVNLLDIW